MEATIHLPITFGQLVSMARQLPQEEKNHLIKLLQADEKSEPIPTKEELLAQLATDYRLLQQGKLKTRPANELIAELESEGYL